MQPLSTRGLLRFTAATASRTRVLPRDPYPLLAEEKDLAQRPLVYPRISICLNIQKDASI